MALDSMAKIHRGASTERRTFHESSSKKPAISSRRLSKKSVIPIWNNDA
jgi:hypothetical protein